MGTKNNLRSALQEMLRHPVRTLVPPWSWKAAALTAFVRAAAFFATNLRSGQGQAIKAFLVEGVFALFAGGLIGAISQQLRRTEPRWATSALVCVGLPGIMLLAQSIVHHFAHTPHLSGGLNLAFFLAVLSAAFTLYAMRQGAMLGGSDATTVHHDLQALPKIVLGFILIIPTFLISRIQKQTKN
jgi:peptidoglycan/LPS O-acetylase OafA/YrhL